MDLTKHPQKVLSTFPVVFIGLLITILAFASTTTLDSPTLGVYPIKYFALSGNLIRALVFIGIGLFGITCLERLPDPLFWAKMLLASIGAYVWQVWSWQQLPITWGNIVQSANSNGFYDASLQVSPLMLLRDPTSVNTLASIHAQGNMPGKILLFHGLRLITSSTTVMGHSIVIFGLLGAILAFNIGRRLFKNETAAWYAFLLYVVAPPRFVFGPILNVISPLPIMIALSLFSLAAERRKILFGLLSGVSLYLCCFFEPLPLIGTTLFLAIIIINFWNQPANPKLICLLLSAPIVGFLLSHILALLTVQYDIFVSLYSALQHALLYNSIAQLPYFGSIASNLSEFFISNGAVQLAIIGIFARQLHWGIFRKSTNLSHPDKLWSAQILAAVLLATILLLDLTAINRGEVTRLWIFLSGLYQIIIGGIIASFGSLLLFRIVFGLTMLQSVLMLWGVGFVAG